MATKTHGPRCKKVEKTRTCRVLELDGGKGLIRIDEDGQSATYRLDRIDEVIGGEGWTFTKAVLNDDGSITINEPYAVFLSALGSSNDGCECLGFLRYGKCRHCACLRALSRAGKLS